MAPPGVHPQTLQVTINTNFNQPLNRSQGWSVPLDKISEDLGEIVNLKVSEVHVDSKKLFGVVAVVCHDLQLIGCSNWQYNTTTGDFESNACNLFTFGEGAGDTADPDIYFQVSFDAENGTITYQTDNVTEADYWYQQSILTQGTQSVAAANVIHRKIGRAAQATGSNADSNHQPMHVKRPKHDRLTFHFKNLSAYQDATFPWGFEHSISFKLTFSRIEEPFYSELPQFHRMCD